MLIHDYENIEGVSDFFKNNLDCIESLIVRILLSKYSVDDIELLFNPTVGGFSCKEFVLKDSGKVVAKIETRTVSGDFDIVELKVNYRQEVKHWIDPNLIGVKEQQC